MHPWIRFPMKDQTLDETGRCVKNLGALSRNAMKFGSPSYPNRPIEGNRPSFG
jgi:hypothetical protein